MDPGAPQEQSIEKKVRGARGASRKGGAGNEDVIKELTDPRSVIFAMLLAGGKVQFVSRHADDAKPVSEFTTSLADMATDTEQNWPPEMKDVLSPANLTENDQAEISTAGAFLGWTKDPVPGVTDREISPKTLREFIILRLQAASKNDPEKLKRFTEKAFFFADQAEFKKYADANKVMAERIAAFQKEIADFFQCAPHKREKRNDKIKQAIAEKRFTKDKFTAMVERENRMDDAVEKLQSGTPLSDVEREFGTSISEFFKGVKHPGMEAWLLESLRTATLRPAGKAVAEPVLTVHHFIRWGTAQKKRGELKPGVPDAIADYIRTGFIRRNLSLNDSMFVEAVVDDICEQVSAYYATGELPDGMTGYDPITTTVTNLLEKMMNDENLCTAFPEPGKTGGEYMIKPADGNMEGQTIARAHQFITHLSNAGIDPEFMKVAFFFATLRKQDDLKRLILDIEKYLVEKNLFVGQNRRRLATTAVFFFLLHAFNPKTYPCDGRSGLEAFYGFIEENIKDALIRAIPQDAPRVRPRPDPVAAVQAESEKVVIELMDSDDEGAGPAPKPVPAAAAPEPVPVPAPAAAQVPAPAPVGEKRKKPENPSFTVAEAKRLKKALVLEVEKLLQENVCDKAEITPAIIAELQACFGSDIDDHISKWCKTKNLPNTGIGQTLLVYTDYVPATGFDAPLALMLNTRSYPRYRMNAFAYEVLDAAFTSIDKASYSPFTPAKFADAMTMALGIERMINSPADGAGA